MTLPNPWVVVVAGFAVRRGEILLAERPPGKHLAGLWEFPGGKIEPGESPEIALEREIAEELGVNCKTGVLLDAITHGYDSFHLLMLLYEVRLAGEPQAIVASRVGWFSPGAAARLPLPPADAPLVGRFAAYVKRCEGP